MMHLVKISGLIQILCNISINLLYVVYQVVNVAIPSGSIPRYLPLNILILLCIVPGYISLTQIDDKVLRWVLLVFNIIITGILFVLYYNVFKNFVVHA